MYSRIIPLFAAGMWALSLPAQTLPEPWRAVPQFTVPAPGKAIFSTLPLRQFLNGHQPLPVCSIPLIVIPIPKNLEQMPVLRSPAGKMDNMPVMVPAPPCKEEKR